MQDNDLLKIIGLIIPDLRAVQNITLKNLSVWIIVIIMKLFMICFFLWFIVKILNVNFSIGK